ncbi:MAG TPA: autotransporter-associated beta strand repeat-containing protein, partial [Pirellulales bacterium]
NNTIVVNSSLSAANLTIGNQTANTGDVIQVQDLQMTAGQTLNVLGNNGYTLQLLEVDDSSDSAPIYLNPSAGTEILVLGYTGDKPLLAPGSQGTLLFGEEPVAGMSQTVSAGPGKVTLSATNVTYISPVAPATAPLTLPAGYKPGGLSASYYSYAGAAALLSPATAGLGPTAVVNPVNSPAPLADTMMGNRPLGVTPNEFNSSTAVFTGLLDITTGGTYEFQTANDDEGMLKIDGQTLLSANATGGTQTLNSSVIASLYLSPGYHTITFREYNNTSYGGMDVQYSGPDTSSNNLPSNFQAIPASALAYLSGLPSADNGYGYAAQLTNDFQLPASTSSTIDTLGSVYNTTLGTLELGAGSTLNVNSGNNGSIGAGWLGVAGLTTVQGAGVTVNVGSTTTDSAGMFWLIGGVSDGGNGFTKTGSGALILGASTDFSGMLTANQGSVILTDPSALPTGGTLINSASSTIGGNTLVKSSTTVTNGDTSGLFVGEGVSGTGIATGSVITAITSSTTFTLSIAASAAESSENLTFTTGASLDLSGVPDVLGNVTINGSGLPIMAANSNAALWNSSGSTASLDGTLTIGSSGTTIGGYGNITLSGALSDGGNGFTKVGPDTLLLNVANSLTGTVTVSDGTLQLGDPGSLGAAAGAT